MTVTNEVEVRTIADGFVAREQPPPERTLRYASVPKQDGPCYVDIHQPNQARKRLLCRSFM
jgi:hypothetical protein